MSQQQRTEAPPDLSIVIVSWNVRELLKDCLRSLRNSIDGLTFEIFVVENDSRDGSADMVRREFPDVRLIANSDNVGFGKEELVYCRIFQQHFGGLDDLSWMGWTKTGVCRDRCEEYVGYRCKP